MTESNFINTSGVAKIETYQHNTMIRRNKSSNKSNGDVYRSDDDNDGIMMNNGETCRKKESQNTNITNLSLSPSSSHSISSLDNATSTDSASHDGWGPAIASVAGNVLEWYDFAVFGYLSDILGEVFFPPNQSIDSTTMESFLVFGLAFLVRPIGGVMLGYIGDKYGRKKALVISIFLMAFPTFIMGTLPGYNKVGSWAIFFLVIVRILQGLSVGGQLVSSLVFMLERRSPIHWGFYGSFTMAAAIFGSLLGGITSFVLRASLTNDQLIAWGWRIPFLCGISVSFFGFYLKSHGSDHNGYHLPGRGVTSNIAEDGIVCDEVDSSYRNATDSSDEIHSIDSTSKNPLVEAFSRKNLRSLFAASLVPMLWSSSFYLSFVWMPIFMTDLSKHPVPGAFLINSISLLFSVCLMFPVGGILSDRYGRVRIMTIGGTMLFVLGPVMVIVIGMGKPVIALLAQCTLGISISLFSAPMCAWLVEAFEPRARLTSVAIGYNIAQAIAGGLTPFIATLITDKLGQNWPGWILSVVAATSLVGLLCVAPNTNNIATNKSKQCLTSSTPLEQAKIQNEVL